jgi:hypothetical protein
MKRHLFLAALLAASAAAGAQTQSGSSIGSNTGGTSAANIPAPLPAPSTGTSADAAATQGTAPRTSEPYGAVVGPVVTLPPATRCDALIGDERARCLREQASFGSSGPTSTGASSGGTK